MKDSINIQISVDPTFNLQELTKKKKKKQKKIERKKRTKTERFVDWQTANKSKRIKKKNTW